MCNTKGQNKRDALQDVPYCLKSGFSPARLERLYSIPELCSKYLRALIFNISYYHLKVNEGIMNKEFKSMFVERDF